MKFFDYAKEFDYAAPVYGFIVPTSCEVAACDASAGRQQGRIY